MDSSEAEVDDEVMMTVDDPAERTEKSPHVPTYWNLVVHQPNFRWFLASYIVTHLGEWFTYVASLSLLKSKNEDSQLLISLLVVARMVPNTLFSFPGGFLADSYNRKTVMVVLDLLGALVACTYVLTVRRPVVWLLLCTVLQETLSGLYEPSRSAILPLLFHGEDCVYLDKANVVSTACWSLTAAVGSALGGWVFARSGPEMCFLSDSALYLVSAALMYFGVHGEFNVVALLETKKTPKSRTCKMMSELVAYLRSPKGVYVLFKFCGSFLFGASDVIQVFFATGTHGHLDSERLGWLFGAVGVGCFFGPLSVTEKRSYILTIIGAYALVGIGFTMLGLSREFWMQVIFTVPRSAGAAILWVDSSILLQKETNVTLLGRVSAVDYSLALLGEAISALMAGCLQDSYGWTGFEVAQLLGLMGFGMSLVWVLWYYACHRSSTHDGVELDDDAQVEMEPLRR